MLLPRFAVLALVLSIVGSARADDAVECDKSRDACDAKILELCPAGAEVLEEQELQGTSGVRYRMTFRCRGGAPVAEGAAAPAPVPVPEAAGPTVSGNLTLGDPRVLELQEIDARLNDLVAERSRHGLVGPIVLTSVGFGGSLIFALVAASAATADATGDNFDDSYDFDDDGIDDVDTYDDDTEEANETTVVVASVLAVCSAGVGVGGLVWLLKRTRQRSAYDPEIESLTTRRRQLRQQGVNYSFAVDPVGGRLLLRGRF